MHGHCYRRRGACASRLQILHRVSFSPSIQNVGSKGESNLKSLNQHHVNQIPQQQLNIYITSVLCQWKKIIPCLIFVVAHTAIKKMPARPAQCCSLLSMKYMHMRRVKKETDLVKYHANQQREHTASTQRTQHQVLTTNCHLSCFAMSISHRATSVELSTCRSCLSD